MSTMTPAAGYRTLSGRYDCHRRAEDAPNATVLAEPAACTHRSSISSQYADVGVSARPTHDSASSVRQAMKESRRPYLSARVPQKVGADDETDQSI